MSALDHENDEGNKVLFEPEASGTSDSAAVFLRLRDEFLTYVAEHDPKLVALATLLTLGYTQSEAGRELGRAHSTVVSQTDKLKKLMMDFRETIDTI